MRMTMEQALSHQRILLDLIQDTDVVVCLHRMGPYEDRGRLAAGLETIINRHINNMKAEIVEWTGKPEAEGGLGLSHTDYANCPT
jgi:hypothetical protein